MRWAGEYQDIPSQKIRALMFVFRHSRQRYSLYWDWRSTFGRFPAFFCRATYFDTKGPQVAKDASASRNQLIEIFNRVERFFRRLEVYTSIMRTMTLTNAIVDIMVEVLTILALATKEMKRGRFSKLKSCIFNILD